MVITSLRSWRYFARASAFFVKNNAKQNALGFTKKKYNKNAL